MLAGVLITLLAVYSAESYSIIPCDRAQCKPTYCQNPIKGECCDTCLQDCRVVFCAVPSCPNPITPPGKCCQVCPNKAISPIPTIPQCSVKGQTFRQCGSSCQPTCTKPVSICGAVCIPMCNCPFGLLVDEQTNSCVPQNLCSAAPKKPNRKRGRCFRPLRLGKCNGSHLRYWYNSKTGKCRPFIFGGCKGNRNNFRTKRACQRICKNRY